MSCDTCRPVRMSCIDVVVWHAVFSPAGRRGLRISTTRRRASHSWCLACRVPEFGPTTVVSAALSEMGPSNRASDARSLVFSLQYFALCPIISNTELPLSQHKQRKCPFLCKVQRGTSLKYGGLAFKYSTLESRRCLNRLCTWAVGPHFSSSPQGPLTPTPLVQARLPSLEDPALSSVESDAAVCCGS